MRHRCLMAAAVTVGVNIRKQHWTLKHDVCMCVFGFSAGTAHHNQPTDAPPPPPTDAAGRGGGGGGCRLLHLSKWDNKTSLSCSCLCVTCCPRSSRTSGIPAAGPTTVQDVASKSDEPPFCTGDVTAPLGQIHQRRGNAETN